MAKELRKRCREAAEWGTVGFCGECLQTVQGDAASVSTQGMDSFSRDPKGSAWDGALPFGSRLNERADRRTDQMS